MNKLRDAVVQTLKNKFPEMEASIQPFVGLLDERTDQQISYSAPGILVCTLGATEPPEAIAPWELQAEHGLVISVKAASARERDAKGWELCMKVAELTYRNTWGVPQRYIRPAIISGIRKNEARNPDGTPSGINYWTIQCYNWIQFEALL